MLLFLLLLLTQCGHGVDPGLKAYYPFNGTVEDSVGNHTFEINADSGGFGYAPDYHGTENSAISLSSGGYLVATEASTFCPNVSRTVSFWFKTSNVSSGSFVLGYGGWDSCSKAFRMHINDYGTSNSYYAGSACSNQRILLNYSSNSGYNPEISGWTMWTYTMNTSIGSAMYLNTTLVGTKNESLNYYTQFYSATSHLDNLVVGGLTSASGGAVLTSAFDNQGFSFEGSLDELRLYDYALNESQIEQLYVDFITTLSPTTSPTSIPSLQPTEMPVPEPTSSPVPVILNEDNTVIYVVKGDNDDDEEELIIDMRDYVYYPLDIVDVLNYSSINENYNLEISCTLWYKWKIIDGSGVNITEKGECNDLGILLDYDVVSLTINTSALEKNSVYQFEFFIFPLWSDDAEDTYGSLLLSVSTDTFSLSLSYLRLLVFLEKNLKTEWSHFF